ncbi:MAG: hypothetical protein H3C60_03015 [Sphingomonadaceae bacterium]|nr:hypothetical protein [Sphingomonadaceae bacterium]
MTALRAVTAALLLSLPSAALGSEWLMMVKSENVDPVREAEFEHWYNEIDIPDVLAVPGYERARRGAAVTEDGARPYVALYTITSSDMDKTIIAMLMASWRMDQLGRGTDLIKVTERIYYQREGKGTRSADAPKPTHLYLHRSKGVASKELRAIVNAGLAVGATPYRVYNVLMHEPVAVPDRLVVFEISAASDAAAKDAVKAIETRTGVSGCGADCAALYRVILDVSG